VSQHGVVEGHEVEATAVPSLDLPPQRLDGSLAGLVGKSLARPRDLAVGLRLGLELGQPNL